MTVLIIIGAVLLAAFLGWPATVGLLALSKKRRPKHPETLAEDSIVKGDPAADEGSAKAAEPDPTLESDQVSLPARAAEPSQAAKPDVDPKEVLRGGTIIGLLERAAIVLCIVFDQPVAIAYVVAVKGLGRYPELKESPGASERFIIGTLASMLLAAAVGIVARYLLKLI